MTGKQSTFERYVGTASLVCTAAAVGVSAYQAYLTRVSVESFRDANRNDRIVDVCVDFLASAEKFRAVFEIWAGKVIGDTPLISNDLSKEHYADLVDQAGIAMLDHEARLLILSGQKLDAPVGLIVQARTAAFIMTDSGNVGSRENVDLFIGDLVEGIGFVKDSCNAELGIN